MRRTKIVATIGPASRDPETLARLGIEGVTVEGRDFVALMEGRHPRTGAWLRAQGAVASTPHPIDAVVHREVQGRLAPIHRAAVEEADQQGGEGRQYECELDSAGPVAIAKELRTHGYSILIHTVLVMVAGSREVTVIPWKIGV